MTDASLQDFLAKLDDLIKQATTEKSHYYTASVLRECRGRLATKPSDETPTAYRWRYNVDDQEIRWTLRSTEVSGADVICEPLYLHAKPADEARGSDAAEADRYFNMAGEFGNRIQRAIDLIEDYDRHGSIDHAVKFELKKILDPENALSRQPPPSSSDGERR